MKISEEILCSAVAGCTSTVLGHPLDTVKVALQTAGKDQGAATCASAMLKNHGIGVFFRGISAPLGNAILMNSVMFVAFAEARRRLPDNTFGALAAGAFSGVAQAFLSTPMDFVKIQAQVHGGGSLPLLMRTLRSGRPGILYTGHAMNLCREGVFTAVYLGLYDQLRHIVQGEGSTSLSLVALTSASTGALAWFACYPFDTVKSLQQGQPPTASPAKRSVGAAFAALQVQGLSAFYRGATSSTLRAMLVTCSRLVAYEWLASYFRHG